MIGRPIQVETIYTDRFASVDTRPHRMREYDSVIEVNCYDLIHVTSVLRRNMLGVWTSYLLATLNNSLLSRLFVRVTIQWMMRQWTKPRRILKEAIK